VNETLAEEAQRLVDEGRVDIWGRSEYAIRACVEDEETGYDTGLYANGNFFCSCEWGASHSYTDALCAHALAVRLTVEKENKP